MCVDSVRFCFWYRYRLSVLFFIIGFTFEICGKKSKLFIGVQLEHVLHLVYDVICTEAHHNRRNCNVGRNAEHCVELIEYINNINLNTLKARSQLYNLRRVSCCLLCSQMVAASRVCGVVKAQVETPTTTDLCITTLSCSSVLLLRNIR